MTTETRVAAELSEEAGFATPLRFVTTASLFDGHDAAINVMRRLIQDSGAEVVHLGHNRSVRDVVRAAIQEDVDGIAISSYQGGHTEYFRYAVEMLREHGRRPHPRLRRRRRDDHAGGDRRARGATGSSGSTTPTTGCRSGLVGMIDDLVERRDRATARRPAGARASRTPDDLDDRADALGARGRRVRATAELERLRTEWTAARRRRPGGRRHRHRRRRQEHGHRRAALAASSQHLPDLRVAVLAVDPTRRRTGGALLGDRIRMNSLRHEQIYMRSMATRRQQPVDQRGARRRGRRSCAPPGFDLVIVETAGIGQSDSEIVDLVDLPVYVMTSEFGAASQLEKIDMLDLAELVVINKFDKRGAHDALRDVRKQWRRNRVAFELAEDEVPVYPTIASQFDDPGRHLDVRQPLPGARRARGRRAGPLGPRRSSSSRTSRSATR